MTPSNTSQAISGDRTERAVEAAVLSLIFLVAVSGNLSLWVVVRRTQELRNEANFLLLSLSGADLLVSLLSMPITISTIILGGWIFTTALCTVIGFINMIVFIASVMSLGAISLNRYVRVCRPQAYRNVYTTRNVILIMLGVWGLSALLAMPPLLGWGTYAFLPTQSICFCNWRTSVSYTFFMVAACFGGPCSVMTWCYLNILRTFRQSRRRVADNAAAAVPKAERAPVEVAALGQDDCQGQEKTKGKAEMLVVAPVNFRSSSSLKTTRCENSFMDSEQSSVRGRPGDALQKRDERREKRRQEEIRLSLSFLVIIGVFVMSWLPFCITMFVTVFTDSYVPRPADMTTLLLGYANSCYNPILYGFLNTSFKQAYLRLFNDLCCLLCRKFGDASTTRHVPNTSFRSKAPKSQHFSVAPTSTF